MKQKKFLTKKKIGIAIALVAILVVLFLALGSGSKVGEIISHVTMGNSDLIKVDGNTVSAPEARLFLIADTVEMSQAYSDIDLWNMEVNGQTVAEYMIKNLKDELLILMETVAIGQDYGVELSSAERSLISEAASYYYSQMSPVEQDYFSGKMSDVAQAFEHYVYAMKTISMLADMADSVVSDDEARVITVRQLVTTSESDAQTLIEYFNEGFSFDYLVFNYSVSTVDEVTVSRSDLDSVYAEKAFSLQAGEISDAFLIGNEWYVLYCVSNYLSTETEENRSAILQARQEEAVLKAYEAELESLSFYINDPAWETLSFYEEPLKTTVSFWDVYDNYF